MVFVSKIDVFLLTLSVAVLYPAGDPAVLEVDLVDEDTQKDRRPDLQAQAGLEAHQPDQDSGEDLVVASAVVEASEEDLVEIAVDFEEALEEAVVTEVGMGEEVASDINPTVGVKAKHRPRERPPALEEEEVADLEAVGTVVALMVDQIHRMAVGMVVIAVIVVIVVIVAAANMMTDHPTGTVAQVGAIANRLKNESGEGVADTETVIAKVGMVEMTTPESVPTMVTATMILEANDDTELFDLAHQRMGLSQRVFSVLLAFQFSSLPSPRVSGQNYDSIVLHLKEQNYLHLHTATIDQGKHANCTLSIQIPLDNYDIDHPYRTQTICVAKKTNAENLFPRRPMRYNSRLAGWAGCR